jgi:hypothetical protein
MIWTIPEGGLVDNISTPAVALSGHGRKVNETSLIDLGRSCFIPSYC